MKTIVVSENKADTEVLRRVLKLHFKDLHFIAASTEKEIQVALLDDGPFGFFIIDAELKKSDPEKLSNMIIEMIGNKPFLFIGQSAAITDRISQTLYQSNDHNDHVTKPFDKNHPDDIKNKVKSMLDWAKQEEFENCIEEVDPNNFIQMKLRHFYFMNSFPYDMYLEITPTEYIRIITANKPYSISTLNNYAKKNIKYLYIKKDYHLKYLENEILRCTKVLNKTNSKSEDYYTVLLRSITIFQQYLIVLGATASVFLLADEIIEGLIKLESKYSKLSDSLKYFPKYYEGIASKSLLTAIISIHLVKKMGWESRTTKSKMAICSLLQDYSLPHEEMSRISYPNDARLNEYTDDEQEQYYQHPIVAANTSKLFGKYSDIDYILELHQELPLKKGFPNLVSPLKFTPISCLFNISQFAAAEFDGQKLNRDFVRQTLKMMAKDFSQGNFKLPFQMLKNAFTQN